LILLLTGSARVYLVVRLVEIPVEERQMEATVNPVDAEVDEHQEQGNGEKEVRPAVVLDLVVQAAVTSDLCTKERRETPAAS
jgi:hypothetical protein